MPSSPSCRLWSTRSSSGRMSRRGGPGGASWTASRRGSLTRRFLRALSRHQRRQWPPIKQNIALGFCQLLPTATNEFFIYHDRIVKKSSLVVPFICGLRRSTPPLGPGFNAEQTGRTLWAFAVYMAGLTVILVSFSLKEPFPSSY
jgi:hypothetical protein